VILDSLLCLQWFLWFSGVYLLPYDHNIWISHAAAKVWWKDNRHCVGRYRNTWTESWSFSCCQQHHTRDLSDCHNWVGLVFPLAFRFFYFFYSKRLTSSCCFPDVKPASFCFLTIFHSKNCQGICTIDTILLHWQSGCNCFIFYLMRFMKSNAALIKLFTWWFLWIFKGFINLYRLFLHLVQFAQHSEHGCFLPLVKGWWLGWEVTYLLTLLTR